MPSTANRVIKNTGYLYAKMGITMFVSLYTTRLILEGLGKEDFGIFHLVGGAIAMLGFLNAAMANATQRFMSYAEGEGNKEKQKGIFNVSLLLHFVIACVVGVMLLAAGFFFFDGLLNIPDGRLAAAKVVYGSLIVSTMFTIMSVPYDAMLNAHENMRYYALVGILESLLKLAVAFLCFLYGGDKLVLYGILMACIPLITLTIMRVYCHRHYEECVVAPRRYASRTLFREMTTFAGWNFLASVSSMITQYGLGIVINHFFGVVLNAAQGIANQVSGMLMQFSQNLMKAVNPILVKSAGAQDRARTIYVTLFGCRISTWIMLVFEIPMILMAPAVLRLWLKNVPEWAVVFTQLQLVRSIVEQLFSSVYTLVYAEGHIKNYVIVKSVLNVLPLLVVPCLFMLGWSPVWLYIVWIVCWGLCGGVTNLYFAHIRTQFPIPEYLRHVIAPCAAVTLMGVLPYFCVKTFSDCEMAAWCLSLSSPFIICLTGWLVVLTHDERFKVLSCVKNMLQKQNLKK
ncbi:MAG: hypothetical protein KBT12_01530 [Bacteroidales bacterium]|nr:hypothetical protein [Candidatus Physcousia equi]